MNIEEVLTKHTNLAHSHDRAYEEYKKLEAFMEEVLYKNEEPLHLNDAAGHPVDISLQTPYNLQTMPVGSVVAVDGTEWMLLPDNWVSCYGVEFTNNQMFVNIMRHRDNVYLIHKGC